MAQAAAPEARVVYVDNDPVVLAHARALLTSTPQGATQQWRPEPGVTAPPQVTAWCGVARKR